MSTSARAAADWLRAFQSAGFEIVRAEPHGDLWLRAPEADAEARRELDDRAAEMLAKLGEAPGLLSAVRDAAPSVWTVPADE